MRTMPVLPLLNPFRVACRSCGAVAGQQCTNEVTGQPLRRAVAHHLRIRDAYPDLPAMEDDD